MLPSWNLSITNPSSWSSYSPRQCSSSWHPLFKWNKKEKTLHGQYALTRKLVSQSLRFVNFCLWILAKLRIFFVEFMDFLVEFKHFFIATDVYALPLKFLKSLPADFFLTLFEPNSELHSWNNFKELKKLFLSRPMRDTDTCRHEIC